MRLFLLPLLAASAFAAQPFFFVQLSDPQFGMYSENRGFEHETANLEFAVATLNRLQPAFVVITGDLVNKPADPGQVGEYKRITAKLAPGIKLYSVAGNHDLGNDPTPESLARYRESFGPDYYTFRSGEMAGFVLDSLLEKAPALVAADAAKQEAWLRTELERARHDGIRHLVVFQHHPFYIENPDEKDQYFNVPLEARKRYLALLHEFGVEWVFAGHYHHNAEGKGTEPHMTTTGPIGKPLEGGKSGMRIIAIRNGVLEHHYYDLGDLPHAIE